MNLNEAIKTLRDAGFIYEDTDDWDSDDMPAGMSDDERSHMAWKHNIRTLHSAHSNELPANHLSTRLVDMDKFGSPGERAWTRAMLKNDKDSEIYKRLSELEDELKQTRKPEKRKKLEDRIKWLKNYLNGEGKKDKENNLRGHEISMLARSVANILYKDEDILEKAKEAAEKIQRDIFDARWYHIVEDVVEGIMFENVNYTAHYDEFEKALNPNIDFDFGNPKDIAKQIKNEFWKEMLKNIKIWTY